MSNQLRYRYGDTRPVVAAVDSATVIEVGDIVWQDTDDTKRASGLTWDTNTATTQETLHDRFLGVAEQSSIAGETTPLRIATGGVFEFDCVAATFELGALVGPAKASGNALLDGTVVAVATANLAIGRVCKRYATNTTKVLVEIESTVMRGGVQSYI